MTFRNHLQILFDLSECRHEYAACMHFVQDHKDTNLVYMAETYHTGDRTVLDFAEEIAGLLQRVTHTDSNPLLTGMTSGNIFVECHHPPIMINIARENEHHDNIAVASSDPIEIKIFAEPHYLRLLKKHFDEKYSHIHEARVRWWYTAHGSVESTSITLGPNAREVCKEFYPYLRLNNKSVDPNTFLDSYRTSSAPLLFVSGPPGTGKTSLLRHFIIRNKMTTYVSYDEKVFDNDRMFISFLNSEATLMVFEDAETIVAPRGGTAGGNAMMARFLNVSDGLLKFPDKKIIFTTNESSFERIDQALIRKGRCFAFAHFRNLTETEIINASRVANVPPLEGDGHSLAELLNQDTDGGPEPIRVGF